MFAVRLRKIRSGSFQLKKLCYLPALYQIVCRNRVDIVHLYFANQIVSFNQCVLFLKINKPQKIDLDFLGTFFKLDMGIAEKIGEIEREISRTQKNKATEGHLGLLKAKLAKYRQQLLEPSGKAAVKGDGFDVMKSGDARVALIGFPSVGKSTILSKLTKTHSEAASYEFTTLTCIPGVIEYKGANIQLLDLPGIIEGAAQGKGRGKQVIAVARTADMVVMMLDALKGWLLNFSKKRKNA